MAWGSINIGGVLLRETVTAEQAGGTIRIAGQESYPPSPVATVRAAHANVTAFGTTPGLVVPVSFTDKDELTGFYRVTSGSSVLTDEHNGSVVTATWAMTLERVGSGRDVEVESRVTMVGRQDAIAGTQVPVFWHAPAVGALDYFTGTGTPSGSVVRTSADGAVRVHTGLPVNQVPRWTVTVADYLKGAARLLVDGLRRVGTITPRSAAWAVDNGLVRLTPSSAFPARVRVECWSGSAWVSATEWRFIPGTEVTAAPEMTVLRNDPEEVIIRLAYPQTVGRVTVDLGLRRGSRFVTGVLKRYSAAGMAIVDASGTDLTVETGGIRQTLADGSGNRYVAGSTNAVGNVTGSLTRSNSTVLDFFIGHEVGATPQAGDAFADLLLQYLGSMGERSKVVTR